MNEKITTPINGPLDLTSDIIAYENGELDEPQVVEFFQNLINTGIAWQLQGSYGRTAADLLKCGLCVLPQRKEGAR